MSIGCDAVWRPGEMSQRRIQDFNFEGREFFGNFLVITLAKRAKVHQWPKKPYGTFQTSQNDIR